MYHLGMGGMPGMYHLGYTQGMQVIHHLGIPRVCRLYTTRVCTTLYMPAIHHLGMYHPVYSRVHHRTPLYPGVPVPPYTSCSLPVVRVLGSDWEKGLGESLSSRSEPQECYSGREASARCCSALSG